MDLQPTPPAQQPVNTPPRKLSPIIEADLYYCHHYDGTQVACCRSLGEAIAVAEKDRELNDFGPELGRHCVVRNKRVVYWSRRTNNGDRDTVRVDFLSKGLLDTNVDALEAKDDLRDQRPSPADQAFEAPSLDEEATALLQGLENEIVVSFRVVTTKKSDVVTVIKEAEVSMYSHSVGGGTKTFTTTQLTALKAALKTFRRRTSVEYIRSDSHARQQDGHGTNGKT
jgi:hypothetical protein